MEIGKYKQMMKYLTRKKTNFDHVVYDPNLPDNSNVVVANGELKTENQLKAEVKKEDKKQLEPIIKPEKLYQKLIEYDDVNPDDVMVKYDSATGLFTNKDKSMAFKNVAEARKWNSSFEKYSDTYKKMNDEVKPKVAPQVKPVVKPVAKSVVKPFVKKTPIKPSTLVDIDKDTINIDYKPFPNLSIPEKTPEEIEQEKRFYQMLEQQERERITRENSGLNALIPRVFGNNRKDQKE